MSQRPEYAVTLTINGRRLRRVVIDPHYRERHGESLDDKIILELVGEMNGKHYPIEMTRRDFEYFAVEPVYHCDKPYRVVLVLCLTDSYLGVVNAFRVDR